MYRLYKGFLQIGEFDSILQAKENAPKKDGVYNIIGDDGNKASWIVINGTSYGKNL